VNLFSIFHAETFVFLVAISLFSRVVGRFVAPNDWVVGCVSSLLISIATANLAYFLCLYGDLSTTVFIISFSFLWVSFVVFIRRIYTESEIKRVPMSSTGIGLCIFIFFYFFISATITVSEASSGTHFFQAWNPLYSSYVSESGRFIFDDSNNLTDGFMVGSTNYAPNSLGLVILLSVFGVSDPKMLFYFYNSVCILSSILTFILLLKTIDYKSKYFPQFSFVAMIVVFTLMDYNVRGVYVGNYSDEVLYLSLTLLFYFVVNKRLGLSVHEKFPLILIAASFSVLGRNYGLFYVLMFAGYYSIVTLKYHYSLKYNSLLPSIFSFLKNYRVAISIALLLVSKELIQFVFFGAYYPRDELVDIYPYTAELFFSGLVSALNLGYVSSGFKFNIHSVYLFPLLLSLMVISFSEVKCRKEYIVKLILPCVFLLLPVLLEVVTQYRKSAVFSKLYVPFLFFSIWYPFYVYTNILSCRRIFPNAIVRRSVESVFVISFLFFMYFAYTTTPSYRLYSMAQAENNLKRAIQYRLSNRTQYKRHEELLYENIKATHSESSANELFSRPVMYFHYEPGLGFRYFSGGSVVNDYDFFSDTVQMQLKSADGLHDFFCRLGLPNILIYPVKEQPFIYDKFVNYTFPLGFKDDFSEFISGSLLNYHEGGHGLKLYSFKNYNSSCTDLKLTKEG